jgi:uncharacterized OB-fold protein
MNTDGETRKIPVIEGWFTLEHEGGHLIGNRCKSCGEYFFPKAFFCRNPNCMGEMMEDVRLSGKGRLWSYTVNYFRPPFPYVPPGPFQPYALAVVEMPKEKLMVMGPLANGYAHDKLAVGMEMELAVEPLYTDEEGNDYMIWKWKPVEE